MPITKPHDTMTAQKLGSGLALSIGISSETDKLKTAAIWGRPSVEAVLTQLYPTNISLFLDHMDVVKAGKEMKAFANLLRSKGTQVVTMRDVIADILPTTDISKSQVVNMLLEKVAQLGKQYGIAGDQKEIGNLIVHLLEQDIKQFGEKKALALTTALGLQNSMPLGNIIYARDHINVVLDHLIISNMAEAIREPEVALYMKAYMSILDNPKLIVIPQGEKFEGGDLYVHNNTVYIGIGARTTRGAAFHIFKTLHESTKLSGKDTLRFAMIENGHPSNSFTEIQESMHLDTFSMPTGPKEVVLCGEEAKKRKVYVVEVDVNGGIKVIPTGKNFIDYLTAEGNKLTIVSKDDQTSFGCNILVVDSKTPLLPASPDAKITKELMRMGKSVNVVEMEAITNGFGATHCVVGQLLRA